MKKIDKAVKIFLKREKMEDKAEIPEYIEALKETIMNMYCPSAFDLVDRKEFCWTGKKQRCRKCWRVKEVSLWKNTLKPSPHGTGGLRDEMFSMWQ